MYPVRVQEILLSIFVMVSGVFVFGYVTASVTANLANADSQRAKFLDRIAGIRHFLEVKTPRP